FIGEHAAHVDYWQDLVPGSMFSYNFDVVPAGGVVPRSAVMVHFHGDPRPWSLKELPCKPSSSATTPEPSGSRSCSTTSPAQPPSSTTATAARSKGTTRRSKSRRKRTSDA